MNRSIRHLSFRLLYTVLPAGLLAAAVAACKKDVAEPGPERLAWFENFSTAAPAGPELTCVTFNIQLGFTDSKDPWTATDTGGTLAHIAALKQHLLQVNPDIVCLQEVPENRFNVPVKNFIETLARELNMNYAFGGHGYNDPTGIVPVRGQWGNAILSRYPIAAIENHENEYVSIWERRSILTAILQVHNRSLAVHSLHFIPTAAAEPNAAAYFNRRAGAPQVVLGDFNANTLPLLEANGFTDVFRADTSGVFTGSIDRIFATEGKFTVLGMGVVPGNASLSDHLAHFCVLRLR